MDTAFWANRRVLVTGHTGFFGGWLSLSLLRLGARVGGIALPPEAAPNLHDCLRLDRQMTSHLVDLRDRASLAAAVADCRPEVVFHLAAQALVRRAHADPLATIETNVMGTANLLDALRTVDDLRAVVLVTTDKVYDNREWAWGYRETDPLGGKEPYGASKACCELVADAYRDAYFAGSGVGLATVRAGNLIGGGDWSADRLIPDAVRAFAAGDPLTLRNPAATRPWQHVLGPVDGLLRLAKHLVAAPEEVSEAWNLGPAAADSRPVAWVIDRLAALWQADDADRPVWRADNQTHPYEAQHLSLDSAKARARLDWRPAWALEDALARTVEWYRAQIAGSDMWAVSCGQVEAFADAR